MNMRPIDADVLKQELNPIGPWDWENGNYVKDTINAMPTLDARPIRHGKWIDSLCSECGQYVYEGDARNFCPNCGAKMDGED